MAEGPGGVGEWVVSSNGWRDPLAWLPLRAGRVYDTERPGGNETAVCNGSGGVEVGGEVEGGNGEREGGRGGVGEAEERKPSGVPIRVEERDVALARAAREIERLGKEASEREAEISR